MFGAVVVGTATMDTDHTNGEILSSPIDGYADTLFLANLFTLIILLYQMFSPNTQTLDYFFLSHAPSICAIAVLVSTMSAVQRMTPNHPQINLLQYQNHLMSIVVSQQTPVKANSSQPSTRTEDKILVQSPVPDA